MFTSAYVTPSAWLRSLRVAVALCAVVSIAHAKEILSPTEREWLDAHGPIRYAPDPAFPPFEYFRMDGSLAGITPDILSIVASNLGTTVEAVRYSTWSEVLEGFKRGEADLLGTLTRTPERESFLLFLPPYLQVPYVIFVPARDHESGGVADFKDRRLGVVKNYGVHDWIVREHPEIAVIPVDTTLEAMLMLSQGKLDGVVETLPVGSRVVADNGLGNIRFRPEVLYTTPQHFAVARTNEMLRAILQKGLATVPESERSAIIAKWVVHEQMTPAWHVPRFLLQGLVALLLALGLLGFWTLALRKAVLKRTRELRVSEARYRTLLENLPQRVFLKDTQSLYVSCNAAYARDLRIKSADIAGKTDFDFYPSDLANKYRFDDQRVMRDRITIDVDEEYVDGDKRITIHTVKTPVFDSAGKVIGVLGIFWDITEQKKHEEARKQLEDQLRQSQKMEAIGRLAGGVAHDFNNILTVIMGNAKLMLEDRSLQNESRALAVDIHDASERAADLTRQLLTFSRRQVVHVHPLDVNHVLSRMVRILKPLLGERIDLTCELAPSLPSIHADTSMIEQVIMNLALNARDAMPSGGKLALKTDVRTVEAGEARGSRRVGRFVVLTVSDTGLGMNAEVQAHLFEPFFTTKDVGKGTGLGLATVYGIVRQHEGWIEVDSRPGAGAKFSVFLPAHDQPARAEATFSQPQVGGTETILVVEDEAGVRKMACTCLVRAGYNVLEASHGRQAIEVWESCGGAVDLLLTDMVMPEGLTGLDLARQLIARKPTLKVLFSSGYSEEALDASDPLLTPRNFLAKPYNPEQLARSVRNCLDAT